MYRHFYVDGGSPQEGNVCYQTWEGHGRWISLSTRLARPATDAMATGGSAQKPGRRWRGYTLIPLLALCTALGSPADRSCFLELKPVSSQLAAGDCVQYGQPCETPFPGIEGSSESRLHSRPSQRDGATSVIHWSSAKISAWLLDACLNIFAAGLPSQHFGGRRPVRTLCRHPFQQVAAAALAIRQASDLQGACPPGGRLPAGSIALACTGSQLAMRRRARTCVDPTPSLPYASRP